MKRSLFLLIVIFGLACIFIYFHEARNLWPAKITRFALPKFKLNEIVNVDGSVKKEERSLILYWDYPWGDKSSGAPEGDFVGNCIQTYDRSKIKEAKAVVFHYTTIGQTDIPWTYYRDPDQIYVWWSAEGPAVLRIIGVDLTPFNGFFNWTWTYRQDADVFRGYGYRGYMLNTLKRGKKAVDDILAHKSNKSNIAMWSVSKCDGMSGAVKRMKYFKDMAAAGLNATTLGKCFPGSESIPQNFPMIYPSSMTVHKFYFAFENAEHCHDYITEKFWDNALRNDMVPVVWGSTKEDVLAVAPIHSFIHTDDFESPAKLTEYLQFLDQNDDEYRKYFRWREDESMTDEKMIQLIEEEHPGISVQRPPKNLCELISQNKETKIIKSLHEVFMNESKECLVDEPPKSYFQRLFSL
uniref:Fucosyltransferase n=1 Tax=Ciona savignyi TaxID=51511 RepID=H2YSA2_CIOSA